MALTYLREIRGTAVAFERHLLAKILIIDDDPGIGEVLTRILTTAGYDVKSVTDALEGVSLIKDQDIDLAIVDIFMPQKSGLEIIQEITRSNPDVKLLAMTAFSGQDDIDMRSFAERYGAIGAFEKPFDTEHVLASVAKALGT